MTHPTPHLEQATTDPAAPVYTHPLPLGGWLAVYLDDEGEPEPCYVSPDLTVCVPWVMGDA